MRLFIKLLVINSLFLLFIGCGATEETVESESVTSEYYNDNTLEDTQTTQEKETLDPSITYATAQLGNLANANVKIFEITKDGLVFKWSEKTSALTDLENIGKFNLHNDDVEDDKFYLYEVTGGEDWDADDDGEKDYSSTKNKGTIRAIAKGSDIKTLKDNFKVTYTSEILYQLIEDNVTNNFNPDSLIELIKDKASTILKDIDNNGVVDIKDILTFDPVKHKNYLSDKYIYNINNIIDSIHNKRILTLNLTKDIISKTDITLKVPNTVRKSRTGNNMVLSSDEKTLFIPSKDTGLEIVDVSDIKNPKILSNLIFNDEQFGIQDAYTVRISKDEKTAYILSALSQIQIVDISNKTDPKLINTIKPTIFGDDNDYKDYSIENFVLSSNDEIIYAAVRDEGLFSIDISDKNNPTFVGKVDLIGDDFSSDLKDTFLAVDNSLYIESYKDYKFYIEKFIFNENNNSLTQVGAFAYTDLNIALEGITVSKDNKTMILRDISGNLYIYDINDFSNIKLVSTVKNLNVEYLQINNNKIFARTNSKIFVIDISDQTDPKVVYELDRAVLYDSTPIFTFSKDSTKMFALSNAFSKFYLYIFDISNTKNERLISFLEPQLPYTYPERAFISKDETKVFMANRNYTSIIDITDKTKPKLIYNNYDNINYNSLAYDVALSSDETKLFTASNEQGFKIFDISDLNNSEKIIDVNELNNSSIKYVKNIEISNDDQILYISNYNQILAVDISDINNPKLIKTIYKSNNTIVDLSLSSDNNKLFFITPTSFIALDISNLNNIKNICEVSIYEEEYLFKRMKLSKDETKVFITSLNTHNFFTVDISDLKNPTYSYLYNTKINNSYNLDISNDEKLAFVTSLNYGISVIDISDTKNLKYLGNIQTLDQAMTLDLSYDNTKIFVGTKRGFFEIIDITDLNKLK